MGEIIIDTISEYELYVKREVESIDNIDKETKEKLSKLIFMCFLDGVKFSTGRKIKKELS